jgi:hypothetical protein
MENTRNQFPFNGPPLQQEEKNANTRQQEDFTWILNEGMLRDEGSLFGIAGAEITDKLESINSYYQTKTAFPQQQKRYLEEKIASLKAEIESARDELAEVRSAQQASVSKEKISYQLWPVAFQFLAILAVSCFNFFLVRYWLSPVITSDVICLGIYLCGLFSVYIGRSIILNSGDEDSDEVSNAVLKKSYLREFGVAAAVSFFICTITFKSYPVQNSVAAFLLMFLLFLCGKVLVNTLFRLKKEINASFRIMKTRYKARRQERNFSRKMEEAEKALRESIEALQEPEITLAKLQAEQQYKTHVFRSEYNLALQSRQALNKPSLKQLA